MAELQAIPARHGVATFVPEGHSIKIINTSGRQIVSTWAFALPSTKADEAETAGQKVNDKSKESCEESSDVKKTAGESSESKKVTKEQAKNRNAKSKKNTSAEIPSQEESEKRTKLNNKQDEKSNQTQNSTWSSYMKVPSMPGWSSKEKNDTQGQEQQKESRAWSSYLPTGKAFSSYIPKSASNSMSAFASTHNRDPSKTYLEQLQDFSRTPVGAAGLAAISGSGYGSSLYAGYQAYQNLPKKTESLESMSMSHSHVSTLHLTPQTNDTFVSNLREPMLTLIEDTSSGQHDTVMAACNPQHFQRLDIDKWEEHGSCAENLVLALNELNARAGLKGGQAVGADVTVDTAPAPLNLFMNGMDGKKLVLKTAECKAEAFARFRAERDVVVVMSACPQELDGNEPADAHFVVEEISMRQRMAPRKLKSYQAASTVGTGDLADDDKSGVGLGSVSRHTPRKTTANKADVSKPKQETKKPDLSRTDDKENQPTDSSPKDEEKKPERRKPRKLSTKPKAKM